MNKGFALSRQQIASLGADLIAHLRSALHDTSDRRGWTERNFDALRSFEPNGFILEVSPWSSPDGSEGRGEFLWDFTARVDGMGLLIAAESEWQNDLDAITQDFMKILYVRSPIKLIICRVDERRVKAADVCDHLFRFMRQSCSEFSPADLFILYCRKWSEDGITNNDIIYQLQIDGEPCNRNIKDERFKLA